MKLGSPKPRGIMASGWTTSKVYEDVHWDDDSKLGLYVDIHFDTIINPSQESIFPIELLQDGIYSSVNWTPQASGMRIPNDVAEQLEKDWAKFLNRPTPVRQIYYADEIDETKNFYEGSAKQISINIYERNAEARAICIKKYGARCSVCGFDFGEKFGEIGAGFIHVHHLKPLSKIRKGYKLNPIEDLRPVCPNCHAMIHQRKPEPYSIEELKAILNRAVV
jgi:5-methylcytosine-specific restriction protein A